jgi:hypothetical protein
LAISEGTPLCSSRGTSYFGVFKTFIIDADINTTSQIEKRFTVQVSGTEPADPETEG